LENEGGFPSSIMFGSTAPSTAKFQGWSVEGIKRFNELYDIVEKEQQSNLGLTFDKDFIKHCAKEKDALDKKHSKKKNLLYEACCHDLWNSSSSIGHKTNNSTSFQLMEMRNENSFNQMTDFSTKCIADNLCDDYIDAEAKNSDDDDMEDDNHSIVSSCGYDSVAGRND